MSGCEIKCGGLCCAVFPYPSSPDELRERWRWWPSTSEMLRDDLYIADMLIPLDPDEALARMNKYGSFPLQHSNGHTPAGIATGDISTLYTCAHWDEETGLCGSFEERPKMCREYPYAAKCLHCGVNAPIDVIRAVIEQSGDDPDF